ncbi:MAG: hypothetical protein MRY49_01505 [Candidatus Pacebacteria bacterium]|nr:hypothetical protein [Candidatus Paceibacterota bacterium]
MYIWIILVVIAQLLNATVALIDKYIVTKPGLPKPVVYAFYVNLLSAASLIVLFIGDIFHSFVPAYKGLSIPMLSELTLPHGKVIILSLISGFVILEALIFLFKAFRTADASDVVPMTSAVTAITTYIISIFVFDTFLSTNALIAFVLMVLGTILISRLRCSFRVVKLAVLAGVFFGTHSIILKMIFNEANFTDGFFWTRIAGVIAALSLLLFRSPRSRILGQSKEGGKNGGLWIIGNKTLAGIAAILILAAINIGDVALINALNGLQFVFLILFAAILGRKTPKEVGENVEHKDLIQKVIAVSLIVIGFFILFI